MSKWKAALKNGTRSGMTFQQLVDFSNALDMNPDYDYDEYYDYDYDYNPTDPPTAGPTFGFTTTTTGGPPPPGGTLPPLPTSRPPMTTRPPGPRPTFGTGNSGCKDSSEPTCDSSYPPVDGKCRGLPEFENGKGLGQTMTPYARLVPANYCTDDPVNPERPRCRHELKSLNAIIQSSSVSKVIKKLPNSAEICNYLETEINSYHK